VALAVSSSTTIWHEPPRYSSEQLAITDWPLLSAILQARGISSRDEAAGFIAPAQIPLGDPLLLPDMDRAVDLIRAVADNGGKIGLFGDYDVDGISSTAMLTRALRRLGAEVVPMIPHRVQDGYGLNPRAVDAFAEAGCELLITADCGSSNVVEIELALARGMRVIVLDHHRVHHELPGQVAFVSPKRPDNRYPETELATVGVAYTLARALLGDAEAEMYLPYAALGTVADVVSLRGENRALVARGLEALRRWSLPGFKSLCTIAGLERRNVDAFDIGYVIGPRINAAGRMDTPAVALDWFLAEDLPAAQPLSQRLDQLNRARQEDTRRVLAEAELQIRCQPGGADAPALVVDGLGWNVGVVGIVAGRLAERFHRPAVVIARGPELSTGSARTAGKVDIVDAIRSCRDLLERFGGHTAAAGVTLETASIDAFRTALGDAVLAQLDGELQKREIRLDAEITHTDLSLLTVDRLAVLEPCGNDNRRPLLLVSGLRPQRVRTSRDGKHLLFNVADTNGRSHQAAFFNAGDRMPELLACPRVDLAAEIRRNRWNGSERLQLRVTDFRPFEP
jgi:single-stranded-DNA-specific exonuclease